MFIQIGSVYYNTINIVRVYTEDESKSITLKFFALILDCTNGKQYRNYYTTKEDRDKDFNKLTAHRKLKT